MTITELLNEVEARGITLLVDESRLHYQGNKSALRPEIINALKERKTEILALMTCGQCGTLLSGPINKFWRVLLSTTLLISEGA
jgi:hypothetical protein